MLACALVGEGGSWKPVAPSLEGLVLDEPGEEGKGLHGAELRHHVAASCKR